jgi:hypothetical protein
LLTGGAILKSFGLKGTYYSSFGLMSTQAPVGEIFPPADLRELQRQVDELDGTPLAIAMPGRQNRPHLKTLSCRTGAVLNELLPGASFQTMSYPINVPRVLTKSITDRYFVCCRGGGQTFNVGTADLNCLSAFFLEKSRHAPRWCGA